MPQVLTGEALDAVLARLRSGLSQEQASLLDKPLSGPGLNSCVACPGSGKSTTLGQVVVRAMLDPDVTDILVLSSTVSAKNTALKKIQDAIRACGLEEEGISFPESNVRTIHSVALRGNCPPGQPRLQIANARPYVEAAMDDALEEERLALAGVSDWAEHWREAQSADLGKAVEAVREKLPFASSEQRGRTLYKDTVSDEDEIAAAFKSGLDGRKPVADTVRVRSELTNRFLSADSTNSRRASIIEDVEERMQHANVTDHAGSIRRFAESKQPVAARGQVVFVDEAQDANACQVEIVKAAWRAGARVVIFGDPCQGIFRFAGAKANPMRDLVLAAQKEELDVHENVLTENFRSTKQILDAAQRVLLPEDDDMRTSFSSREGKEVRELVSENEPAHIAAEIKRQIAFGRCAGDIAVIRFKNLSYGKDIHAALSKESVPTSILGMGSDVRHPAARVLAILRSVLGEEEEDDSTVYTLQAGVRAVTGCQFTDETRGIVAELAAENGASLLETYLDADSMAAVMGRVHKPKGQKRDLFGNAVAPTEAVQVRNLRRSIKIFSDAVRLVNRWTDAVLTNEDMDGALVVFKNGVAYPGKPRGTTVVAESKLAQLLLQIHAQLLPERDPRAQELKPLLACADSVAVDDITDIQSFASLETLRFQEGNTDDKVILSTIHRFKGRERPVVIVAGMGKGIDEVFTTSADLLPYTGLAAEDYNTRSREIDREARLERRRLLHVALSRPKEELILSAQGELAACFDL